MPSPTIIHQEYEQDGQDITKYYNQSLNYHFPPALYLPNAGFYDCTALFTRKINDYLDKIIF